MKGEKVKKEGAEGGAKEGSEVKNRREKKKV